MRFHPKSRFPDLSTTDPLGLDEEVIVCQSIIPADAVRHVLRLPSPCPSQDGTNDETGILCSGFPAAHVWYFTATSPEQHAGTVGLSEECNRLHIGTAETITAIAKQCPVASLDVVWLPAGSVEAFLTQARPRVLVVHTVSVEGPPSFQGYVIWRAYRSVTIYVLQQDTDTPLASDCIQSIQFLTTCYPLSNETRQLRAIRSWMAFNIRIVSLNAQQEVGPLKEMFTQRFGGSVIEIIDLGPDVPRVHNKRLPSLTHVRDVSRRIFASSDRKTQCIVLFNSDIVFADNNGRQDNGQNASERPPSTVYGFLQWMERQVTCAVNPQQLVGVCRMDFSSSSSGCGQIDGQRLVLAQAGAQPCRLGFDVFAWNSSDRFLSTIPDDCQLRIGQAWWDFAVPLWAYSNRLRYTLVCSKTGVFFHHMHPIQWTASWGRLAGEFMRLFPAFNVSLALIPAAQSGLAALQTCWGGMGRGLGYGCKRPLTTHENHKQSDDVDPDEFLLGIGDGRVCVKRGLDGSFRIFSACSDSGVHPPPVLYLGAIEAALSHTAQQQQPSPLVDVLEQCAANGSFHLGHALGAHAMQAAGAEGSVSVRDLDPLLVARWIACSAETGVPAHRKQAVSVAVRVLDYCPKLASQPYRTEAREQIETQYLQLLPSVRDAHTRFNTASFDRWLPGPRSDTTLILVLQQPAVTSETLQTLATFFNCCTDWKERLNGCTLVLPPNTTTHGAGEQLRMVFGPRLIKSVTTAAAAGWRSFVAGGMAGDSKYAIVLADRWRFLHPKPFLADADRVFIHEPVATAVHLNRGALAQVQDVGSSLDDKFVAGLVYHDPINYCALPIATQGSGVCFPAVIAHVERMRQTQAERELSFPTVYCVSAPLPQGVRV